MCYCWVLWLYWECSWLTTAEQIYLQVQIKLPDKSSGTRKGDLGGSSGLRSSKLMNLTSLTRSDSGRPADLSEVLWELRQLIKQTSLKELSAVNRTYEINGKGRFETSAGVGNVSEAERNQLGVSLRNSNRYLTSPAPECPVFGAL